MITITNIPGGDPVLGREVRELMTPGVVSVVEDAVVASARRALIQHGVHAVLVLDREHRRPLGWATARGLLRLLHRDSDLVPVRDAIGEPAVVVSPSATAAEAADVLLTHGLTHLLVAQGDEAAPEGVLSELDLARLDCGGGLR